MAEKMLGKPMPPKEILQLLKIKGWSQAELARQLDVDFTTVCCWVTDRRKPSGPAKKLMRMWLAEARQGVPA